MHISTIFRERLPHKPYCSNDLQHGLLIRPTESALKYLHLQPNAPLQTAWLVFDLDYPGGAFAWEGGNLPPPTLSVINPKNGHAHLFYGLTAPVTTSDAGRDAPIRYAAAIEAAFHAQLRADPGYAGLIAKNPFHEAWKTIWVPRLYDLSELAEYVNLPRRVPKRQSIGLGRNCALFDELRSWAYRWVREYKRNGANTSVWNEVVLRQAESLNTFEAALSLGEIKAIAKSVAKWTWSRFSEEVFSAIQSARGKLGGRPKSRTANGEPWTVLGISRSTYYRRLSSTSAG